MTTTVDAALRAATAAGVDRLDAQLLLAEVLGQSRTWLFAHGDDAVSSEALARFQDWAGRRAAGEPFAYLVGRKEFHGLLLDVSSAVLVPRPDTETLVAWALERIREVPAARVADLGTGSGAIALALKHSEAGAHITATDVSPDALAVARGNATRLGLDVEFLAGPWWTPLAGRRFHVVASNPPYIAGDDHHLAALAHEPRLALTPEGDGLRSLREIIDGAPAHLEPGGWLLLEHGHDQAGAVAALLADRGFTDVSTRHDLGGNARCTGGRCAKASSG